MPASAPEPYARSVYCCGCARYVLARLTTGVEIYPGRLHLAANVFWVCDACGNYVGAHKNTSHAPMGCIPTPAVRYVRRRIHAALDPLWMSGLIGRKEIYRRLSEALGREYHTAWVRSREDGERVLALIRDIQSTF